ncbi:MAG: glycosyltransferase family 4 protein [Chloroflexi bacterium]|nr:glycosyltransferase family 4 protein [Chloroflexota bacterium]MBI3339598.1 glycosyltransferase family 4 protein [Chloroflexota bacterium]
MKILIVGNYYYPEHIGGIEIVSYNLAKHYRIFGHQVRWMAADVPPKFRGAQEGDVPIRAWNIAEEKLGFPSPIPHPSVLVELYNNIRWCNIAHLQDCLYPINILAFLILKILRKPVLITQYAKFIPYSQWYKRILQSVAYGTIGRAMFQTADQLVFITANVREGMSRVNPGKKYDIVPLGVDTGFFSPAPTQERNKFRAEISGNAEIPLLLFVGRMVERKGVRLIRPLIEKHKDWHWVLVGRPDDYSPANWGLPNLTYFENVSEETLRDLYASADLLVHPSKGEGFTLTASECMACGTPIVISKESLFEINEADRGLFFPVAPETADIEHATSEALKEPERLALLRAKVRDYAVARLSWEKVADEYLAALERIRANLVVSEIN